MLIKGKILAAINGAVADATLKLPKWALVPAEDLKSYGKVVVEVLSPTDVDEMINSDFDLTLYTCTKDSKNRITVRLNRV